jgi:copper transport protein
MVSARPSTAFEIRIALLTNLPGVYRVTWRAVSALDGHSTQGTFTFTVGTTSSATASDAPRGPTLLDVLVAVGRWIEDAALLIAFGMLFIAWLASRRRPIDWVHPRMLPPLLVALAAGLVVTTGEAMAAGVTVEGALTYLGAGPAGIARVARVLFEALACVAVLTRIRPLLLIALPMALVALSASGHALGGQPSWLGVAVDVGHLAAAGIWVGGIIALATLRPPDGWHASGRELLARFTPFALAGFGASVGLGAIQAVANVGDASALLTTAYGRILIAKASAVAAIIPLSVLAWRHRRTHLRAEAAIGLIVVGAAALLASFPVPARTPAVAEVTVTTTASGLPRGNDLTLGAQAGQTLVGLTVSPAVPGVNTVTVYVNTGDGGTINQTLDITADINGQGVRLRACGAPCRIATVRLVGHEAISVHVAGAQGGTAEFRLPQIPTPDGSTLLRMARARMGRLRSVTLHETLTGGAGTTILTNYQEVAPDLLEWTQPNGSGTIVVGAIRYTRQKTDGPWTVETGNPTVVEPAYSWTLFVPDIGAHVLGSSLVGAVNTTVIGFFAGSPATPVWFRFYVDAHGLVQRADMSAPGHFMTQTFANFDGPVRITDPIP